MNSLIVLPLAVRAFSYYYMPRVAHKIPYAQVIFIQSETVLVVTQEVNVSLNLLSTHLHPIEATT